MVFELSSSVIIVNCLLQERLKAENFALLYPRVHRRNQAPTSYYLEICYHPGKSSTVNRRVYRLICKLCLQDFILSIHCSC